MRRGQLFSTISFLLAVGACRQAAPIVLPPEPEPIEAGIAPPPGPYAPGFDALRYDVSMALPDTGTFITGETTATIRLDGARRGPLSLDFSGLAVTGVFVNGLNAEFEHVDGKLSIPLQGAIGDTVYVAVAYAGRPDDGLILGRNLHGRPTAFADNWPNRARYWFPSIDHPSDKAAVSFTVSAGLNRRVIANGELLGSEGGIWRWENREPIPTYTMVVGAAEFAVERVGESCDEGGCIEVSTWIFPPDTAAASPSFRRAAEMVSIFSDLIAPFPYEKLAHVQSSTRFGGMENVTAIFYPEDALAQGRDIELTVAHETVHQWFGDSVTEADWRHLWLSEGFATYFSALFYERADGDEKFQEVMEDFRKQYLRSGVTTQPIVDLSEDNLFELLNANNYDKGAWVLHMLRRLLGDEVFFDGIRDYYRRYEHGTALTADLRRSLERASGRGLEEFFDRWVFSPGHPRFAVRWSIAEETRVELEQVQSNDWPTYVGPLTLEYSTSDGLVRKVVEVDSRIEVVILPERASNFRVDPDDDVLMEVVSIQESDSR